MVPAEVLPPATSASQLTSYTRCPRAYAARYVYGFEPEFRSLNLVLGSAIHGAVGWWFEERLAGRSPTVEAAESVLAADLAAGTTDARVRWKDTTPASLEADACRFLRAYLTAHGDLPVAAVEVPFDVPLAAPATGEVFGRNVRGYFDLVLEDGTIIELKTSAKGWSPFDLERHLQLGAYVHATNMQGDRTSVIAHVIVKLKRDTPRVEAHPVVRSAAENRWWLVAAAEIEAAIAGLSFPPIPSPLCRECEYGQRCSRWSETDQPSASPDRRSLPVLATAPVASLP